jgi:hypothetical protein
MGIRVPKIAELENLPEQERQQLWKRSVRQAAMRGWPLWALMSICLSILLLYGLVELAARMGFTMRWYLWPVFGAAAGCPAGLLVGKLLVRKATKIIANRKRG